MQGAFGVVSCGFGEDVKGQHDQAIARQHSQGFREHLMHRGLAAPRIGIVKAGQVIMHKAGAVDQL